MKKPKEDLFRIIEAMTPSEKRYFKIHFASEGIVLTELFDYLNAQEDYDEAQVKNHFSQKIARNYKVYKSQLQQLLLKSLQAYHSQNRIRSKIRMGLEEIDILTDKQLFDIALQRLQRIKRLCHKYEEFTYLIEITRREYFLNHLSVDLPGLSELPLYDTVNQSLQHLRRQNMLTHLSNELMDLVRKSETRSLVPEEQKSLEQLVQSDLIQTDAAALSFQEQLSRNIVFTQIHKLLNNPKEEFQRRQENVRLFDKFSHFKDALPFHYLGVLRNYLNFCLSDSRWKEVQKVIEEGKKFAGKHKHLQSHLTYFLYAEMEMHYRFCNFEHLLEELAPAVMQHLRKNKIEGERITILIYAFICIAYIAQDHHSKASSVIQCMHQAKKEVRDHYAGLIFVIEWIHHFDGRDDFLADNLLQSFLRRKDEADLQQDPFLEDILIFFRKLLRHPDRRTQYAKKLIQQLDRYQKQGLFLLFHHFRLENWLIALSNRLSIAQACKRKDIGMIKEVAG